MELSDFLDIPRMWWICVGFLIPTILGFAIGLMKERLKDKRAEQEEAERKAKEEREVRRQHDKLIDESMRYLHKDRINQQCEYWLGRGFCPVRNREVLTEQMDIYHQLGGNSFVTELVEETLRLPVEIPGEGDIYARKARR